MVSLHNFQVPGVQLQLPYLFATGIGSESHTRRIHQDPVDGPTGTPQKCWCSVPAVGFIVDL